MENQANEVRKNWETDVPNVNLGQKITSSLCYKHCVLAPLEVNFIWAQPKHVQRRFLEPVEYRFEKQVSKAQQSEKLQFETLI